MAISEKINEIIDKRKGRGTYEGKGHLQVVSRKIEFFEKVKQILENYEILRNKVISQIDNQKGDYYNMSVEDPTFEQKIILASPENALKKAKDSLAKLDELKNRFDRETINISVIGRAGQGKSRLLQAISGVENDIIPADSGGDCTGAKSVICNEEGPLHAIVHCYNSNELIGQIQKYLDVLNYGERLRSIDQIQQINLDRFEGKRLSSKEDSYKERLELYINHYDDYSPLINRDIPVDNKEDIRQYVAQYLLDGTKVFLFLAVKEVQIFTKFHFPDAGKIMLVDTIGLGDTSIGLREKMLDTLINDSDAAILLRRPDFERDGIREEDNDLIDMINGHMIGRDLGKWLFCVLNVYNQPERVVEKIYNGLMGKLTILKANFLKQIDCADKVAVEQDLIIPMLECLSSNLIDVDNSLMSSANNLFTECHDEFFTLCGQIKSLSDSNFRKDLNTGGLFDTLYEYELNIARKLEELNLQYKDHTIKCDEIEDEVKKSIRSIINGCPTFDNILDNLNSGKLSAHPDIVYQNMCDHYRAAISDRFEEINNITIVDLQERLKNAVIEILRSDDGGRLNAVPLNTDSENPNNVEWLESFITEKLTNFPLLKNAFNAILNYRLNIEGMLEYYVNTSLEYMDPEETSKFANIDFTQAKTREEFAELIEQGLLTTSTFLSNKLIELVQSLLQVPYQIFYARIRKLREHIIYSKEGERELKNMYREFATYIWKDKFASIATKQVAMIELNEIINSFAENRAKNLFVVKIENR